ncbi:MAG: class I SAM-dependent methyltransferase [Patescibacteria group bacterium]|nr:class I SAM-dependent methyltransferase [Patescibacteria group bacterium]
MEDFYSEPDEPLKRRRLIEYRSRFIEPLFPKDKASKILDIGCGYGLFLDACKKTGYENCEGVEAIDAFAKYADKELGLKNISTGDIFDFLESKEDGCFDVVTAFNIVEHVKKDRVQYLLNLIHKKLRRGGMLIMEVPNADSPLGVQVYFSDLTHEFAFSKKLALTLFRIAGFDDIKVKYHPNLRNPLIKLAQRVLAKVVGLDHRAMFSGNIILVGYKK